MKNDSVKDLTHRIATEIVALPNLDHVYLEGLLWCDTQVYSKDCKNYTLQEWAEGIEMLVQPLRTGEMWMETVGDENSDKIYFGNGSIFENASDAEILGYWIYLNAPKEILEKLKGFKSDFNWLIRNPFIIAADANIAIGVHNTPDISPVPSSESVETMATQDSYWD